MIRKHYKGALYLALVAAVWIAHAIAQDWDASADPDVPQTTRPLRHS